jgi:hypothetical protein
MQNTARARTANRICNLQIRQLYNATSTSGSPMVASYIDGLTIPNSSSHDEEWAKELYLLACDAARITS